MVRPETISKDRRDGMTDRWVVGSKGDVAATAMTGDGIEGVVKRVLVSPEQGWDGWVMRLFDVEPGGHTPRHAHDWPHINFVASGAGTLLLDGAEHPAGARLLRLRAVRPRAPVPGGRRCAALLHLHRPGERRLLSSSRALKSGSPGN